MTPSPDTPAVNGQGLQAAWPQPPAEALPPCDAGLKARWAACSAEADVRIAGTRQETSAVAVDAEPAPAGAPLSEGAPGACPLEARVASLRMLCACREHDRETALPRTAGAGLASQDPRSGPPAAWELVREVASQLQVSERQRADHWHVRVKLQDRHLPDTEVALTRMGNRLDVCFSTSSSDALRLIGNGLAELKPLLERSSGCFVNIALNFVATTDEALPHGR